MSAPPSDATGAVWWLNGDSSAVQGVARTPPDSWTAITTAVAANTPPLPGGSCIASCSRSLEHQEVFWLDNAGGIQGAWRLGTSSFQRPTDYKTQGADTAATGRGGALVAASCARNTMDI